ncbi:unnamed protein product [[Candida] boidinii]|nr:unnamed protein product [[Candida] boidinii]
MDEPATSLPTPQLAALPQKHRPSQMEQLSVFGLDAERQRQAGAGACGLLVTTTQSALHTELVSFSAKII